MTPKCFFSLFLKILSLIFAGNILKWKFLGQKWPQMEMEIGIVQSSMGPEFDLMGPDLRFTKTFWISTAELMVIMNSSLRTETSKNQWV